MSTMPDRLIRNKSKSYKRRSKGRLSPTHDSFVNIFAQSAILGYEKHLLTPESYIWIASDTLEIVYL